MFTEDKTSVILVAQTYNGSPLQLNAPQPDVEMLYTRFIAQKQNLHARGLSVKTLVDPWVKEFRESIQHELENNSPTELVVYWTGHGRVDPHTGVFQLTTSAGQMDILTPDLIQSIVVSPAKESHVEKVLLVLDVCYAQHAEILVEALASSQSNQTQVDDSDEGRPPFQLAVMGSSWVDEKALDKDPNDKDEKNSPYATLIASSVEKWKQEGLLSEWLLKDVYKGALQTATYGCRVGPEWVEQHQYAVFTSPYKGTNLAYFGNRDVDGNISKLHQNDY